MSLWANTIESESEEEEEVVVAKLTGAAAADAAAGGAKWISDPVVPHRWWTGAPTNLKLRHRPVFYPFTWRYELEGSFHFFSFSWQKVIDETYIRGIATTGFDATVTLFNDAVTRRPTHAFLELDFKKIDAAGMWVNTGLKRLGKMMRVQRSEKRAMSNLIGMNVDDALRTCEDIQGNSGIEFVKSHEREMILERYEKCFVRLVYDGEGFVTLVKRT